MLEIVVVHRLCRLIGRTSQAKGLPVTWFQGVLICSFFCGEVYGGVATALMAAISAQPGQQEAPLGLMYLGAVVSGIFAAAAIFCLVWAMPNRRKVPIIGQCRNCGEELESTASGCPMCGHVHHEREQGMAPQRLAA